ncbi:hypothetical protein BDF22DRAFT_741062 [Syncephalis plumigaleata]|nr:hypothetical protein BDF22DRAFT_741062 [Syncephalis plumigaleata]
MDHFNYPISPSTPDLDDTPATSPMSSVTMSELDTINGSTEWNLLHKLFASDIPMFAPSATDAQLNLSSTTCSPYINAHDTSLPMFAAISPRSDMTDVSDESHHHHHHHHQVTSSTSGEDSQCEDTTPSQKAPVRQKPGRKRKGEERRPEDQARVRMLRNRAAAQASRERKRQHVAEMEETNKRLRIDNEALKQRAETAERKQESLMGQVEQLSKQVNDLLAFFASANATVTTPVSEHEAETVLSDVSSHTIFNPSTSSSSSSSLSSSLPATSSILHENNNHAIPNSDGSPEQQLFELLFGETTNSASVTTNTL